MTKLIDIAKLAEVSIATVSNYLNKTKPVSDETAHKVEAALRMLDYVPDPQVQVIRNKRKRIIIMATPTGRTPFFNSIIDEFEKVCSELRYTIVRINLEESDESDKHILDMTLARNAIGMVVLGFHLTSLLKGFGLKHKIPTVTVDWDDLKNEGIPESPQIGARLAIESLLQNGHRHIGLVTGDLKAERCRLQLNSAIKTLRNAGIDVNVDWVFYGDYSPESGVTAAKTLLRQTHRPSAVFCFSDAMAIGFLSGAYQLGLHIPSDISVIGYDDIEMAAYSCPPLTTIQVSTRAIAKNIFDALIGKIDPTTQTTLIDVQPSVHWRASVTPYSSQN